MLRSLALAAGVALAAGQSLAQTVKVGVITDMSGLYADFSGAGSVEATRLAAEEYMAKHPGSRIEVISADHQNKPDVAASLARKWFDTEGVDLIVDVTSSAAALAVSNVAREKNKVFLATNAGSTDFTGKQCSPNTVQWVYDSWSFAQVASTLVKRGEDSWFFITVDYNFGYATEQAAGDVVKAAGGKVLGAVRHPINTSDFSSYLLQAQGSRAKVIGLANAGTDMITAIKQASEFGIVAGGQKIAGLATFISDVHSLGLQAAQGVTLTTFFYWDLNDRTRDFARRFAARRDGRHPSMGQAGNYSAVLAYMDALKQAGSTRDGAAIVKAMRDRGEFDDPVFGPSRVRTDGRKVSAMYLAEVKKPAESKAPWDYYRILATVPPDAAARSLAESKAAGCAMVP